MEAYEVIQVIGKGSFGVVSKIRRKLDGKILVWKEVNYGQMTEKEKQLIVTEVNIIRELRHPHIVRYLDRIIDKQSTKIYIVMEYCEGGDLAQLIRQKKSQKTYVDESLVWKILAHIVLALKECHTRREGSSLKPILHRDLKPGNILLDAQHNAKLGDFGLAKELSSESRFAQTNVGTPYYMSPEIMNELQYDERSDIWALGCLLYELCALTPPFDASNQLALAKKINLGKFRRIPPQYSDHLFNVIRLMLHRQRSQRPRVEDLEKIPHLAHYIRKYGGACAVSSQAPTNSKSYSSKLNELQAYEEELRVRENSITAREKALKEREMEVFRREQQLSYQEEGLSSMANKVEMDNNCHVLYMERTRDKSPTYTSSTCSTSPRFGESAQSMLLHDPSDNQTPTSSHERIIPSIMEFSTTPELSVMKERTTTPEYSPRRRAPLPSLLTRRKSLQQQLGIGTTTDHIFQAAQEHSDWRTKYGHVSPDMFFMRKKSTEELVRTLIT